MLTSNQKSLFYLILFIIFNTIVGLYLLIYFSSSTALYGKLLLVFGNVICILNFLIRKKFSKK